jgi:dTMP kinase
MSDARHPDAPPTDGHCMTGSLIVIEGPNGVGKSTLAEGLVRDLTTGRGKRVHAATQPSRTRLGRFLRESEEILSGRAYALALAADRYDQQATEIQPQLDAEQHVIMDCYVHSSLVLQRLDGLSLAEIWTYNQHVVKPDVTICLDADPGVIARRLAERGHRSRLERIGSSVRECAYYAEACVFLARQGWSYRRIDTRGQTPEQVLASSLQLID